MTEPTLRRSTDSARRQDRGGSTLGRSLPWVAADSAVSLIAGMLLALVLARIIGPEAFGLAAAAQLLGSLAEAFVATPFVEALVQRRRLDVRVADAAFVGMLATGLTCFVALCALAWPLAHLWGVPTLAPLIVIQAATCPLLALRGVPEAIFARKMRFRILAIRNIVAKLAGVVVGIGCALAGAGPWSVIAANVTFAATATALVLAVTPRRPRLRPDAEATRELLSFGMFSLADGILWTVTPRLFGLLVGQVHGLKALGLVSVGFRINDSVSALLAAVTARVALPVFSRAAETPGGLTRVFEQGGRLTTIVSAPVFLGLALVAEDVVAAFLGPKWTGAGPALTAVSLYSLANFSILLAKPAIKAAGRPDLLLWLHGVGLAWVTIGVFATEPLGVEGALLVWASFGLAHFLVLATLLRYAAGVGVRTLWRTIAGPASASAAMAAALWVADTMLPDLSPLPSLSARVAVGAAAYALALIALEGRFLASMLRLAFLTENRP